MMQLEPEVEQKLLDRKMLRIQLIGAPFNIALGLGLFGLFGGGANQVFPFLGNELAVNALVGGGAAGVLWEVLQVVGVIRRKAQISAAQNT